MPMIGSSSSSETLTFNAQNEITSSGYSYDGAGNLTASPGVTYTYNGAEQMTSSTTGGKTTTYTYAGADQNELLSQSTPGGDSYVYTYGRDGRLALQDSSGLRSYMLNDPAAGQILDVTGPDLTTALFLDHGIGNPVEMLSDGGQRLYSVSFDPHGGRIFTAGGNSNWYLYLPYGYKDGIRIYGDGLVKFGLCWCLPGTGSWTQEDTLDAPLEPSIANRYAYAADDPINNVDPSGRIPHALIAKLISAVFSGASLVSVLEGENLAGYITGTGVEIACDACVTAATAGIGLLASTFVCGVIGEAATYAINEQVEEAA